MALLHKYPFKSEEWAVPALEDTTFPEFHSWHWRDNKDFAAELRETSNAKAKAVTKKEKIALIRLAWNESHQEHWRSPHLSSVEAELLAGLNDLLGALVEGRSENEKTKAYKKVFGRVSSAKVKGIRSFYGSLISKIETACSVEGRAVEGGYDEQFEYYTEDRYTPNSKNYPLFKEACADLEQEYFGRRGTDIEGCYADDSEYRQSCGEL